MSETAQEQAEKLVRDLIDAGLSARRYADGTPVCLLVTSAYVEVAKAALLATERAALGRAKKVVDDEYARVLACQTGAEAPSFDADVDQGIRMMAVLLPGLAKRIAALIPASTDEVKPC